MKMSYQWGNNGGFTYCIVQKQSKTKPIKLASNLWALLCAQQDIFCNLFTKHCWEISHLQPPSASAPPPFFSDDKLLLILTILDGKFPGCIINFLTCYEFLFIHLYNPHLIHNTLNAESAWTEWRSLAFYTDLRHCYAHQLCSCDALKCSQVCTVHSPNTHLWSWLHPPWCISCQLFRVPGQSSCAHFRIPALVCQNQPSKTSKIQLW